MSGLGFVEIEEPDKCELCGKIDETRPYGPKGERVCFDCGMKNEPQAQRQFRRQVLGIKEH